MNSVEIRKLIEDSQSYIKQYSGDTELIDLFAQFKRILNHQLVSENLHESLVDLIDVIESSYNDGSIIFIKNENALYNLCYFKQEVKFKVRDIESMDNLIDKIKECGYKGIILENLNEEDIVNFLKAYYLYRKDDGYSKTANNQVKEYNRKCLEMASVEDKYMDLSEDYEEELKNTILYPKEILPYSLDYLDETKKDFSDNWIYQENNKIAFSTIYKKVCDNRFIGLSLRKYRGYWK